MVSDITDRIRAEQLRRRRDRRFKIMADTIPEIIFTNRADGSCDYQNARFYRLTGMETGKAQGWEWMRAFHPEDVERCQERWTGAVHTGQPYECRYRLRLADGEYRWFLARSCPVRNRQGRLTQWFGVATDIHDLVLAENALSEARAAAEVANHAKSEFLANMSHEIRTPMTAIMGYLDVLLSHTREPDDLQILPIIKRNAEYLLELINDILDQSKIEAQRLELQKERFFLLGLVDDVVASMRVRAQEKGLMLNVEYAGPVPETIDSDRTRVRQILLNLISNAIKFTDRGEVRFVIRFLPNETKPEIQFQVIDTGIGITPQQLEMLFKPFMQADGSASRRQGGTGLGLTITKRLVEVLGGRIVVDTQPDKGSTFTVAFPIAPLGDLALVEADELAPSIIPRAPEPQELRLECRVLVVDDRRDVCLLIRHFLEEAGAEVMATENGQKALEAIEDAQTQNHPFDIVVMDMQMPIMDGFAATAELRDRGFELPIIALTAGAMKEEREACFKVGCDTYLSKPVKQNDLVAVVAQYTKKENRQGPTPEPFMQQNKHESDENAARGDGSTLRILVVDDHEDAAKATGMLLKLHGYQVQVALDGESAINDARTFRPDVAILDLGLPDIHGYDLLRALKKQGLSATLFIALSGRGEPADEAQAIAQGFTHYLVKPLDLERLKLLLSR